MHRRFVTRVRPCRSLAVTGLAFALLACAAPGPLREPGAASGDATGDDTVAACAAALVGPVPASASGIDPSRIRLLSWNVGKGSHPDWQRDYDRLADDHDLVLLQEASLGARTRHDFPGDLHWTFAPGWRSAGRVTGVLTLSGTRPLARCSFATTEPLLRTPKATSISEYGLAGSDQTLLVVNVHAVNFSLGLGVYERQFARIAALLEHHVGPVILSGDFNTWRAGRMRIVDDLIRGASLEALTFDVDHRVRVLGRALDHVFVRGLTVLASATSDVHTSDHNPLSVTLQL